jgi:hypothetical protein
MVTDSGQGEINFTHDRTIIHLNLRARKSAPIICHSGSVSADKGSVHDFNVPITGFRRECLLVSIKCHNRELSAIATTLSGRDDADFSAGPVLKLRDNVVCELENYPPVVDLLPYLSHGVEIAFFRPRDQFLDKHGESFGFCPARSNFAMLDQAFSLIFEECQTLISRTPNLFIFAKMSHFSTLV